MQGDLDPKTALDQVEGRLKNALKFLQDGQLSRAYEEIDAAYPLCDSVAWVGGGQPLKGLVGLAREGVAGYMNYPDYEHRRTAEIRIVNMALPEVGHVRRRWHR